MLVFVAFLVSAFFLIRSTLIVMGLYKGPVLRSFEKYGDEENLYFPLVHFIIWLPVFLLVVGFWLFESKIPTSFKSPVSLYCVFTILVFVGYVSYGRLSGFARQHIQLFTLYPRWYSDLRQRTSRLERRRIAYMWLYLPWRLRLMYNSNDAAFLVWVDLVLLATVRAEDDGLIDRSVVLRS